MSADISTVTRARPETPVCIPRVRRWVAMRDFVKFTIDPGQTEAGGRFVYALLGEEAERMYQRFRQDPNGARILAERRWLRTVLLDQERLRTLAPGSLGQAYVDHLDEEDLSFEWLVRTGASAADEILGALDEERRLVVESVTDQHDLWHVLTGYGTDALGELALTAFIFEQVRWPAYTYMLAVAKLTSRRGSHKRALIDEAKRRGREARWLPAQDWERLLEEPIDEVRAELGLNPPSFYAHRAEAGRLRPKDSL